MGRRCASDRIDSAETASVVKCTTRSPQTTRPAYEDSLFCTHQINKWIGTMSSCERIYPSLSFSSLLCPQTNTGNFFVLWVSEKNTRIHTYMYAHIWRGKRKKNRNLKDGTHYTFVFSFFRSPRRMKKRSENTHTNTWSTKKKKKCSGETLLANSTRLTNGWMSPREKRNKERTWNRRRK